jgi:hypothetical protein
LFALQRFVRHHSVDDDKEKRNRKKMLSFDVRSFV